MHYSFCEWPPNIILNYNLPGKEIDTFQVSSCMSKSKLGAYTSALILIGMFMSFSAVSQGGPCAKSGQAKAECLVGSYGPVILNTSHPVTIDSLLPGISKVRICI